MRNKIILLAVFAVAMAIMAGVAPAEEAAKPADPCYECHAEKSPGAVDYWRASAHPGAGVGCVDCHGTDVDLNHSRDARVDAAVCGKCHKEAYAQHTSSKHAISLRTGRGCTRNMPAADNNDLTCSICHRDGKGEPLVQTECAMFLAQSAEMRGVGCDACHKVETGCDSCHTKHGTSLEYAGRAETCGVCHMGPDHAQLEMWRGSSHGVIFADRGPEEGPTCKTCHMPEGTHNVSLGIATGKPEDLFMRERGRMVELCSKCHAQSFAARALESADSIQNQSFAILAEAQEIVETLYNEGLLMPMPAEREKHPLFGHEFVIGPHMLYENISGVEATYFRMMMFYYMSAFKGAFHQSPDYAHWYGNAPLKLALSDIKSQAALLRKTGNIEQRLNNLSGMTINSTGAGRDVEGLKNALRRLNEQLLSGQVGDEEFRQMKNRLLNEMGL